MISITSDKLMALLSSSYELGYHTSGGDAVDDEELVKSLCEKFKIDLSSKSQSIQPDAEYRSYTVEELRSYPHLSTFMHADYGKSYIYHMPEENATVFFFCDRFLPCAMVNNDGFPFDKPMRFIGVNLLDPKEMVV